MAAQSSSPMVVSADLAALLAMRGAHPNLVRILGVHHNSGRAELMVEFVHGRTVAALLAAGPGRLPLAEALTIARDAARGVFFLHQLRDDQGRSYGFIHGGLTAGKLVVGFDGVTRVAGLERVAATDGVPPPDADHAAPEQRVDPEHDDRRVDVFALGAILLRMITGLRLIDGAIPVPSSADLPHCPGGLEPVLRRALARDPARRYQTAEDLRAALEGFAVREGHSLDAAEVGKLVRHLAPEAMNEPAGRLIPPRPDRSMWSHAASRWSPVDTRLDFGAGGAEAVRAVGARSPAEATAVSAAAAGAAGATLTADGAAVLRRVAPPNPLVPAATAGAATMSVAALDDDGQPMLPADAAAVLAELEGDARHPGGRLAPSPAGRIPATGYMPGIEPPPRMALEPSPRTVLEPPPAMAPYPAPPLQVDPRAQFMMLAPPPSAERWRWLPTRSLAGTIALLLFLFAAAVAIAYVASG